MRHAMRWPAECWRSPCADRQLLRLHVGEARATDQKPCQGESNKILTVVFLLSALPEIIFYKSKTRPECGQTLFCLFFALFPKCNENASWAPQSPLLLSLSLSTISDSCLKRMIGLYDLARFSFCAQAHAHLGLHISNIGFHWRGWRARLCATNKQ